MGSQSLDPDSWYCINREGWFSNNCPGTPDQALAYKCHVGSQIMSHDPGDCWNSGPYSYKFWDLESGTEHEDPMCDFECS